MSEKVRFVVLLAILALSIGLAVFINSSAGHVLITNG